jgi:glyoxylate/hydroxypyruvate reductase
MKVIYYNAAEQLDHGQQFQQRMPEAEVRYWRPGDNAAADYAVVWKPPAAMLTGRNDLKAIFNLGAGVDAIMQLNQQIPDHVPIIRMEDAGMGEQMADYVSYAVLRYYRHFDQYQRQAERHVWHQKKPEKKSDFRIAVLGLGVLGTVIAERLQMLNFPVRGWSRSEKDLPGIECFAGEDGLKHCLAEARAVVSILPLTEQTTGLLNRVTLGCLPAGAYLINVGRGAHVNENDLLELLRDGHIAGAMLDVFQSEPLPDNHPLWTHPDVTITPHISALTVVDEGNAQVVEKLRRLEQGLPVTGIIDRAAGY